MRDLTLADVPVVAILVRLRGMHARRDRPVFDEMRRVGFEIEAEDPGREVAFAAVGQPWKLRGGERRRDVDFRTFADPGFAKMAFNFRLDGSMLSTETRVLLTDERSRRAFRRYWLVIRPFSGLIRAALAARNRAQSGGVAFANGVQPRPIYPRRNPCTSRSASSQSF